MVTFDLQLFICYTVSRGSSVGIATDYRLDGSGIASLWREILRTCPDRPWRTPSLLHNGYWVFLGGKERLGRDADPSPPSSAVGGDFPHRSTTALGPTQPPAQWALGPSRG
jgi:hypothetical protein